MNAATLRRGGVLHRAAAEAASGRDGDKEEELARPVWGGGREEGAGQRKRHCTSTGKAG